MEEETESLEKKLPGDWNILLKKNGARPARVFVGFRKQLVFMLSKRNPKKNPPMDLLVTCKLPKLHEPFCFCM